MVLCFRSRKWTKSFSRKKRQIERWKNFAGDDIEENDELLDIASKLEKLGLRRMDALHVACAIYARCDYFITTDNGILKKSEKVPSILICDPVNFIREFENVN